MEFFFSFADHLKEGPRIEGDKHTYDVGDLVDLNCTAAKSQPPAELHWYINDKEVSINDTLNFFTQCSKK